MYKSPNILINHLIKNILTIIKEENGDKIEIVIQLEAAFQSEQDREIFTKTTAENIRDRELSSIIESYLQYNTSEDTAIH